jgi:adenylate cyclase
MPPLGRESSRNGSWRAACALGVAHSAGAVFVFVYLSYVSPSEAPARVSTPGLDLIFFVAFAAIAFPLTGLGCEFVARRALAWQRGGRRPTEAEGAGTLTLARRLAGVTFLPWIAAAIFFGSLNAYYGHTSRYIGKVAFTTLDGGLVSCAIGFLLLELALRPTVAAVLDGAPPARRTVAGVRLRLFVAWALGSGVPLAGLMVLPVASQGATVRADIGPAVFALSTVGLLTGLTMTAVTAKSLSEPITEVRRALEQVQAGRLDVGVTVDRGGDLGELQAGVNRMVEGLRERQQLADLFGRHVGTEVAQRAIEQGSGLDSEQREASVLFVDLIGSTAMAEVLPPHAVLDTLNAYFDAVVDVVSREGGWVNKFEGDGALCVFGAPAMQPDHAARALRAARALHLRLRDLATEYPGIDAAIGVSSGVVVAGNVGMETRYEYTLLGRPVNEAARLTDLAKARVGRVLASEGALERSGDEASAWSSLGTVALRGQSAPTAIFQPLESAEIGDVTGVAESLAQPRTSGL